MKESFFTKTDKLIRLGDKFIAQSGTKKFHDKAYDLLKEANLHELFHIEEMPSFAFSKKFPEHQNFEAWEFSDLPLTVARGRNCFIDIYFWRRRPTVIHNHHFAGAFQCLQGLNVDSEFTFKTSRKLTKHHSLGELSLKRTAELRRGEIVKINLLDKFIHQNHHQADLTVNLCFRTSEVPKKNLSNFLYSGLRFEKDPKILGRLERLFAFTKMSDLDPLKLNLNLADAIGFILATHEVKSANPRFLGLKDVFIKQIKTELNLNLLDLLEQHEAELSKQESLYE